MFWSVDVKIVFLKCLNIKEEVAVKVFKKQNSTGNKMHKNSTLV